MLLAFLIGTWGVAQGVVYNRNPAWQLRGQVNYVKIFCRGALAYFAPTVFFSYGTFLSPSNLNATVPLFSNRHVSSLPALASQPFRNCFVLEKFVNSRKRQAMNTNCDSSSLETVA